MPKKLWNPGANLASDLFITAFDGEALVVGLIKRGDTGDLATPGGFREAGESAVDAAIREGWEEISLKVAPSEMELVFEGKVDDPRNEADRWIETAAFHVHRTFDQLKAMVAGDDAAEVSIELLNESLIQKLYQPHVGMVKSIVSNPRFIERINRLQPQIG